MRKMQNIVFLGAGSIGTALGNSLAVRPDLNVSLLSIELDVVETITSSHINQKYFPNIRLMPTLKATSNPDILKEAGLVFIALPSVVVVEYMKGIQHLQKALAVTIRLFPIAWLSILLILYVRSKVLRLHAKL